MNSLPKWSCTTACEAEALIAWTVHELDSAMVRACRFIALGVRAGDEQHDLKLAIARADRGDVEPLRKLFPELARFIQRPKQARGQHYQKNNFDPVKEAMRDVRVIRALWLRNFGMKNRSASDPVSALRIAANRWSVDESVVANRVKKARK